MKYRKKPVIIEAVKFSHVSPDGIFLHETGVVKPSWFYAALGSGVAFLNSENRLIIRTLKGDHTCRPGDYVIRGVKVELYPCKPDIFEMTYEEVED